MQGGGRISGAMGRYRWPALLLLGAAAVWLLAELASSRAGAQATGASAGGGMLVVAGQVTRDTYGLYLVDPERRTICVYQWLPETRKLRLMASRDFSFDCQLDEYNTEPAPREIRTLVEQHRRMSEATTRP